MRDAVHVALAADWLYAGWAAAQVWPDGTRMAAESIGRLRRSVDDFGTGANSEECKDQLDVLDDAGPGVGLVERDPSAESRGSWSRSVPAPHRHRGLIVMGGFPTTGQRLWSACDSA